MEVVNEPVIKKPTEVIEAIKEIRKEKGLGIIEAMVYYCEKNNIDEQTLGTLLKSNTAFKTILSKEAAELFLLKKTV